MKYLLSFNENLLDNNRTIKKMIKSIQKNLDPKYLKGMWKENKDLKNYAGYCYIATEALYYMLGGPNSGYTPYVLSNRELA